MDISKFYLGKKEKPLDNFPSDGGFCGIFRTIAVVGDSLSSGEYEIRNENGTPFYEDFFDISWGQYLARVVGTKVYNFSRGGMTAKEYIDSFADANGFWNADKKAQAYIVALGVNDFNQLKAGNIELGSFSDIDLKDYKNNKKTFIGYYAYIIQKYKEIQPTAKFFLMTMPKSYWFDEKTFKEYSDIIYKFAEIFDNCYVLDFYKYAPDYTDKTFTENFFTNGHLNATGYLLTAKMVASYIDYIIRSDFKAFSHSAIIGTDIEKLGK